MTAEAAFAVGDRVEASVGPVAHGGHMVARVPAGDASVVIFVRHALPGERVVVQITDVAKRFFRGDAVEVLEASPDRVPAPCPLAHPDGCGGCDFQHVSLPAQRDLKAAVVAEQLQRLAGLEVDVRVEEVPGAPDGLHWRSRMQYVGLPGGDYGLRKNHSHEVVAVPECLIAAPDARVVLVGQPPAGDTVTETVRGRSFEVAGDGFWQVHPGAPETLVSSVLELLDPQPGERAMDLYAGVGLFSAFLAEAVTETGSVISVEGDRRASDLAKGNLRDLRQVRTKAGRVDRVLKDLDTMADVVVLDPPREGARKDVVSAVVDLAPRAIAYVACDPAALARDLGYFAERGYRLSTLRAFDLFPMTHHVECVALVERAC
ncbi:class I SAM-dependent RNA methyltransferase [Nocardioides marmoriginsengisoli]|uniref:Class I SAM-dependent RNA methyltransferase n=1 Tax=Nocardioides marmoriginsengisoli TaxID=661483 RepID=A0A3N0CR13_9ACTN|nr:TRAM domain-containing protein [Nocardioides marmoriginsengisoli]RNL65476.1 class I SAM-dependent RNA methyltransferase [Nocardioides marmoriginsengisoli]